MIQRLGAMKAQRLDTHRVVRQKSRLQELFSDQLTRQIGNTSSNSRQSSRAAAVTTASTSVPAAMPMAAPAASPAATPAAPSMPAVTPAATPVTTPAAAPAAAATTTKPSADSGPFVPTFQDAIVTGLGVSVPLNSAYFATPETAQWIAQKYGTGEVVQTPFLADGSPFHASAQEYQIRLADGRLMNAGFLADYYRAMPEAEFPGLADHMIRDLLARGV